MCGALPLFTVMVVLELDFYKVTNECKNFMKQTTIGLGTLEHLCKTFHELLNI
jgi:hypothetical protein